MCLSMHEKVTGGPVVVIVGAHSLFAMPQIDVNALGEQSAIRTARNALEDERNRCRHPFI